MGCDASECNDSPSSAPAVMVVDAETKDPICSAKVTLLDGELTTTQDGAPDPEACEGIYARFPRRAGTYEVKVEAAGYVPAQDTLHVTENDCGKLMIEPEGPRDGLPGRAQVMTIGVVRDQR